MPARASDCRSAARAVRNRGFPATAGFSLRTGRPRWARVVGRQYQLEVVLIAICQVAQVLRRGTNVLLRIENIAHAIEAGGGRHQLHQATRAALGQRVRIAAGFGDHHRLDERRLEPARPGGGFNHLRDTGRICAAARPVACSGSKSFMGGFDHDLVACIDRDIGIVDGPLCVGECEDRGDRGSRAQQRDARAC